jgi:glucose-1-phosphate adenylyltransferase
MVVSLMLKNYHSMVGIRTRIGFDTTIENCYVMGSDNYQTLEQIAELLKKAAPPIMGIGDRVRSKMPLLIKIPI